MKDKKIEKLLQVFDQGQKNTINLIASENYVSEDILKAVGSRLTDKYSEGYPQRRYYPGNEVVDEIESTAMERALKAFALDPALWGVNVQPLSGSPANVEVYAALLKPGEKIMGMALTSGGHLTHGHKVSFTGRFWTPVQYGVGEDGFIDYNAVEQLAVRERPQIIVSGFTAYPRTIDFKRFGEIAKKVGAYHMADISHIAGLVLAGVHPSPFPYADVVTTTTHKTLRGPRGAIIFSSKLKVLSSQLSLSEAIDKAVFPGFQGGPHDNVTAAKAVMFYEAMQPGFKKYAAQIVGNAKTLAEELMRLGCTLITGGTDNHLMLLDVRSFGIDGAEAEKRLEAVGIIANRNTIPGDVSAFKPSGMRMGTPAVTTRGMKEKEMKQIAALIHETLTNGDSAAIKKEVLALAKRFA